MYEICVQQMRAAIVAAQQGTAPQRLGNADPGVLQQDVYPARGEDRWVAISVFDAAQTGTSGCSWPAARPLADWTREQDDRELVDRLQAAGIAAGVLQDIEDLMEHDAALRARGALVDAAASEARALRPRAHADHLFARPVAALPRAGHSVNTTPRSSRGVGRPDAQRAARNWKPRGC